VACDTCLGYASFGAELNTKMTGKRAAKTRLRVNRDKFGFNLI